MFILIKNKFCSVSSSSKVIKACLLLLKPITDSRHDFNHASLTASHQASVYLSGLGYNKAMLSF